MVLGSAVVTSEGRGQVGDSYEQGPLKGDCCPETAGISALPRCPLQSWSPTRNRPHQPGATC